MGGDRFSSGDASARGDRSRGRRHRRRHRQPVGETHRSGYDAGKKIKGGKRHIVTDTGGLPVAVMVHEADIRDRAGAAGLLASTAISYPWPSHIFAEGGYGGGKLRGAIKRVGGIQINAFEWSGRNQQVQMVPWTFVDDDFSILKAARMLDGHRRAHNDYPTALGHALGYAAVTMSRAPRSCRRRVIDVSGDGVNNDGYQANTAYRHFSFDGIIVNGLVIAGAEPDPVGHYRTRVLRGPGAFLEIAAGFHDYEEAMRRKLLREILGNALAGDRNRRGRDRG